MGKQGCSDLTGGQITPQYPFFTEDAQRHKPHLFKILNIQNISNIFLISMPFNLIKNLYT